MTTPAERYAAARERARSSDLTDFEATLSFALDDFQREGCQAVADGHSVLVAAPTGAGKTVVGEFAVAHAQRRGREGLLHDAHQGAQQPEVRRPEGGLRPRQRGPAHGRHVDQSRTPTSS